jgi:hypothetical protein
MQSTIMELDHRVSGAFALSLLWHRDLDDVTLTIRDNRSGRWLELPVERDLALKAFMHPFAHAASIGIDYVTDLAAATSAAV